MKFNPHRQQATTTCGNGSAWSAADGESTRSTQRRVLVRQQSSCSYLECPCTSQHLSTLRGGTLKPDTDRDHSYTPLQTTRWWVVNGGRGRTPNLPGKKLCTTCFKKIYTYLTLTAGKPRPKVSQPNHRHHRLFGTYWMNQIRLRQRLTTDKLKN